MLQSSVLVVVTVLLRSEMSLQCQTHPFHPTNPTPCHAPRHVYCNLKIAHVQLVDSGWLASVCFVSVESYLGWLGRARGMTLDNPIGWWLKAGVDGSH